SFTSYRISILYIYNFFLSLFLFFFVSFYFCSFFFFFFFNDPATTEIYTLSLHDALPISALPVLRHRLLVKPEADLEGITPDSVRSEEHTSELQSLAYLVCRLLLEKKKKKKTQ